MVVVGWGSRHREEVIDIKGGGYGGLVVVVVVVTAAGEEGRGLGRRLPAWG